LSPGSQQLSLHKPAGVGLAKARIIWAAKPLGLLCLFLWVMYPSVADQVDYTRTMLIGFILGVIYGFVIYGNIYYQFINLRQESMRTRPNRLPEEYYWGHIDKTLHRNK
jgi:hypothetical protein